ncbi:MAG: class I SAM-dependent methyltransferase [Lentisphaerae bacterium]|nr:class I SAM-dependent methyltransferase [Lentisphaerota bacterium]
MVKTDSVRRTSRCANLDAVETTDFHRDLINRKGFLRRIYDEWYRALAAAVPAGEGAVLELGSGPGFLRHYLPDLITSDVVRCEGVDRVEDAATLSFGPASLRGIVMVDVLHHLPDPRAFFAEATRCLRPGGVVAMIEPWVTPWSRFVWHYLHHEPFEPRATAWETPVTGRLQGANSALPWMVFKRDRPRFEAEFPALRIRTIRLMMPFRYLLSGGLARYSFQPAWSFGAWRFLEERALGPAMPALALFALLVVERVNAGARESPSDKTVGVGTSSS